MLLDVSHRSRHERWIRATVPVQLQGAISPSPLRLTPTPEFEFGVEDDDMFPSPDSWEEIRNSFRF